MKHAAGRSSEVMSEQHILVNPLHLCGHLKKNKHQSNGKKACLLVLDQCGLGLVLRCTVKNPNPSMWFYKEMISYNSKY